MKLQHNGINEIVAADKVVICENSDGQMVISSIKGSGITFKMTEHGTVIAALTTEEQKATKIPMDDCAVSIYVGSDGTWMNFKASNGQQCSFNMENLADRDGHIVKSALNGWCVDRREQAAKIRDR